MTVISPIQHTADVCLWPSLFSQESHFYEENENTLGGAIVGGAIVECEIVFSAQLTSHMLFRQKL